MHNLGTLEAVCKEKDTLIVRRLRPLTQTPEGILRVFDQIRACHRETGWGDVRTIEQLFDPRSLIWLVDDVGLMLVCPISTTVGHCHVFFWDRRLRGREPVAKEAIRWVRANTTLRQLITGIGTEFLATIAFAKRVGFTEIARQEDRVILALQM